MIIYLAAPYSHKNKIIISIRVELVNKKAAKLMEQGNIVFSPITHCHYISKYCKVDPCDPFFWLRQDLPFISLCDKLMIYKLSGWKESKGIKIEIKEAKRLNKIIEYIDE